MSFLINSYVFAGVTPSVIWYADYSGSGGYEIERTETSTLPVSGDTYYLGTNNNGASNAIETDAPSWDTGTSDGSWTITAESVSKSDGAWGVNYIFGKSALGSANQTITEIISSNTSAAYWIGFLRSSDLSPTRNSEEVCRYGWYLDNGGGYTTPLLNGVGIGNTGAWTTSSKFKIEILLT